MIMYVVKYDIHPDKIEAYLDWSKSAIKRLLEVPGLTEFRGYRPITGSYQVVLSFEFPDLDTWTAWSTHEVVQRLTDERRAYVLNENTELWGPSRIVPAPIRP